MARRLARGTQLQRGDGETPEVFVKIAQAISIDGPSQSAGITQLDDHDLPAGYLAKLKTSLDGGQITLELNFDPDDTTHGQLQDDLKDMVNFPNWRLVVPGATKVWKFAGTVTALGPAHPVADAVKANVTIEVQGEPVLEAVGA